VPAIENLRESSHSLAGTSEHEPPRQQARLAFASFLMLFVELALIRWTAANNVYVNNATNFVLLASFLGIGVGFLSARSKRDYLRWTPLALIVLVGFELAFPVILATQSGPHPYQGLNGMAALPRPLTLSVVFVLSVAVMAGLGQAVARIFVTFKPLRAYRLDVAGSIAGIAVFSGLSFLDMPPLAWAVIAGAGLVILLAPGGRWWQWALVGGFIVLLGVESFAPGEQWSPHPAAGNDHTRPVCLGQQRSLSSSTLAPHTAQAEAVLLLPLPPCHEGVAERRPDHRGRNGK